MLRIQLSPHRRLNAPWWAVALALIAALTFLQLGRWQWHRAAEKRITAAAFQTGMAGPITALGKNPMTSLPRYAPVNVSGVYDAKHQFLLDNLIVNGQVGYEVLTPLHLDDGRWLMINRGWVALPNHGRAQLPEIALPEGVARSMHGWLDDLPVTGIAAGRAAPTADEQPGAGVGSANWPKRTSFPTTAELAAVLGHPVESRQLLLAPGEIDGYLLDWKPSSAGVTPERNLSYAIQWWGLGALSLFLLVFVNLEKS